MTTAELGPWEERVLSDLINVRSPAIIKSNGVTYNVRTRKQTLWRTSEGELNPDKASGVLLAAHPT